MAKRAIYLCPKFENSKNVLFWMEADDVKQRNSLGKPDSEEKYIFTTDARRLPGKKQRCPVNGASVSLLKAVDDSYYLLYGDYSIRKATTDDLLKLIIPVCKTVVRSF